MFVSQIVLCSIGFLLHYVGSQGKNKSGSFFISAFDHI